MKEVLMEKGYKERRLWWGYIRNILYAYPNILEKSCTQKLEPLEDKILVAVSNALEDILKRPFGETTVNIIKMVFFEKTHKLYGCALALAISERTAKRYQSIFIIAVARKMRLIQADDTL